MKGRRILFHDPDPRVVRVAERALAATGAGVDLATSESALLGLLDRARYDLVMLRYEPAPGDANGARLLELVADRCADGRIALHATARSEELLPLFAGGRRVRNLVARSDGSVDAEELIVTAAKLLRGDLFGVEKYLRWGIEPDALAINDSREKAAYVRQVARYAERLGCGERVVEVVEGIADELITNAIWNAPRDEEGRPRYADRSRRDPLRLEDHEAATLTFACDGTYMAIAQGDPFGALTQETILEYLNRCLATGPQPLAPDASAGAGIGLFHVFQSGSKLIVNLYPGRRTEVIALVDLRLGMRRLRQRPRSFHVFIAGGEAPGDGREGVREG